MKVFFLSTLSRISPVPSVIHVRGLPRRRRVRIYTTTPQRSLGVLYMRGNHLLVRGNESQGGGQRRRRGRMKGGGVFRNQRMIEFFQENGASLAPAPKIQVNRKTLPTRAIIASSSSDSPLSSCRVDKDPTGRADTHDVPVGNTMWYAICSRTGEASFSGVHSSRTPLLIARPCGGERQMSKRSKCMYVRM